MVVGAVSSRSVIMKIEAGSSDDNADRTALERDDAPRTVVGAYVTPWLVQSAGGAL